MTERQKSLSRRIAEFVEHSWYADAAWLTGLVPLAHVFDFLAQRKKHRSLESSWRAPVPVIVVGNITVGGTGKTPLVIALAQHLLTLGYHPGIVSRGYRSKAPHYPYFVDATNDATQVGDEPLLIHRRSACPVVIDADRVTAVQHLLAKESCDVIISDDGMQHYALARDIEICVIDGQRGLGNRHLLPRGPLRETASRLGDVDFIVVNGEQTEELSDQLGRYASKPPYTMLLEPQRIQALQTDTERRHALATGPVHAVAGIGNPQRFFDALIEQGFEVVSHPFPDHHDYRREELQFADKHPILMTEKDAVKCQSLGIDNAWYQPIAAVLPELFWQALDDKLRALQKPTTV